VGGSKGTQITIFFLLQPGGKGFRPIFKRIDTYIGKIYAQLALAPLCPEAEAE